MLDALSGQLTEAEAEREAALALTRGWESLVRNAYEAWAYYGVVAELRPRKFWAVVSFDGADARAVETDEIVAGWQAVSPDRRVPEAVFQTEDGRLFAMKSEAARELDYYGFSSVRGRDTSAGGNTRDLMGHRVLLVYEMRSRRPVQVVPFGRAPFSEETVSGLGEAVEFHGHGLNREVLAPIARRLAS